MVPELPQTKPPLTIAYQPPLQLSVETTGPLTGKRSPLRA
jgi:hypothetical protein